MKHLEGEVIKVLHRHSCKESGILWKCLLLCTGCSVQALEFLLEQQGRKVLQNIAGQDAMFGFLRTVSHYLFLFLSVPF